MRASNWVIALVAGMMTGPAHAEFDNPASPEAGTVFIFTDGRVERFVRSAGEEQIWATRRGREYARSVNPAEPILKWEIGDRLGNRTVFGKTEKLWPPKPGNSARFRVLTEIERDGRTRRSVQNWTCRVQKMSYLTVPAGTYTTLPISCVRYSVNTMRPLQKRTWWWAPDIGHYVQRRYESIRDGETTEYRLCAALPERRASDARIDAILETGC